MIDKDKLKRTLDRDPGAFAASSDVLNGLYSLPIADVRRLYNECKLILGEKEETVPLGQLNMADEISRQYARLSQLFETVLADDSTPTNQIAQVGNSVTAVLDRMVKLQETLQREANLTLITTVLIEHLRAQPKEFQEKLLAEYKEKAIAAGLEFFE